jgi:hypothetical protein
VQKGIQSQAIRAFVSNVPDMAKFCMEMLYPSGGLTSVLVQKLNHCVEFVAGDGTLLRELLHPDKQAISLRYSLAHAIVPAGQTSQPHSLTTSEVYYILSGTGEMYIDGETQLVAHIRQVVLKREYFSESG